MRILIYSGSDFLSYEDMKRVRGLDWSKTRYRKSIELFLSRCYSIIPLMGAAGMYFANTQTANCMNRFFQTNEEPFEVTSKDCPPGYYRVKRVR